MSLQALVGGRAVSTARDVAYHFGFVLNEVAKRVTKGHWPTNSESLEKLGTNSDEIAKVTQSLCTFMEKSIDPNYRTMQEALEGSSLFDHSDGATILVFATIGIIESGVFFSGIRDASILGNQPLASQRDLIEQARTLLDEFIRKKE